MSNIKGVKVEAHEGPMCEDTVYTNLDHFLDKQVVKHLKKNPGDMAQHAGWDFCGYIWYEDKLDVWMEEVWVYHKLQETRQEKNLMTLINGVNEDYGSE